MIEMYLFEQLAAVAECGTLVAASEQLHITQPSMSRAMKKLEETVGVPLFEHKGNRLELNEYGRLAAQYARRILDSQAEMVTRIRALERSRRTILLGSCAPGPLYELPPMLSSLYPDQTISTEIREETTLIAGLKQGTYQQIILNRETEDPEISCHFCGTESLCFSLPKDHPLADRKTLSFAEMDGETFLVYSEVGIWDGIHRQGMPHSRFILQPDRASLREITRSSSLPAFVTDLSLRVFGQDNGRISIPISDPSATMSFWCCCMKTQEKKYLKWFQTLEQKYRVR
ncbi:MAG: LysR family transcriptional regulator [Clostridia bacterium]|nr:LysR family transcriptional regulator [Clostridia bacterium]